MYSPSVFFNDGLVLYVFEILTFMGVKRPLRTLWRNLHMFLDILEFTVANQKLFRKNYFENMVSD